MQCLFRILNLCVIWHRKFGCRWYICWWYLLFLVKLSCCHVYQAWDSLVISALPRISAIFFTIRLFPSESSFLIFLKICHNSFQKLTQISKSDPKIWLKKYVYWKFDFEKSKKIICHKCNKSAFRKNMYISKIGCKNLWKLAMKVPQLGNNSW